jgi:hypothetical protein
VVVTNAELHNLATSNVKKQKISEHKNEHPQKLAIRSGK